MVNQIYKNQNTLIRQILFTVLLGLILAYLSAFLILPIESWVHIGLNADTFYQSIYFWKRSVIEPRLIFFAYIRWWHLFTNMSPIPLSYYLPFLPLCVFLGVLIFKIKSLQSVSNIIKTKKDHSFKMKDKKNPKDMTTTKDKKVKPKHSKKIRGK